LIHEGLELNVPQHVAPRRVKKLTLG
jgi:hypothetical protein